MHGIAFHGSQESHELTCKNHATLPGFQVTWGCWLLTRNRESHCISYTVLQTAQFRPSTQSEHQTSFVAVEDQLQPSAL